MNGRVNGRENEERRKERRKAGRNKLRRLVQHVRQPHLLVPNKKHVGIVGVPEAAQHADHIHRTCT